MSVTGIGEPGQIDSLFVSDGTLPVLGVQPILGWWFSRKDDLSGSAATVMLAYGYWQRKFGGDASVIGLRLIIDGQAREVIGVMPQKFRFMDRKFGLIEHID